MKKNKVSDGLAKRYSSPQVLLAIPNYYYINIKIIIIQQKCHQNKTLIFLHVVDT